MGKKFLSCWRRTRLETLQHESNLQKLLLIHGISLLDWLHAKKNSKMCTMTLNIRPLVQQKRIMQEWTKKQSWPCPARFCSTSGWPGVSSAWFFWILHAQRDWSSPGPTSRKIPPQKFYSGQWEENCFFSMANTKNLIPQDKLKRVCWKRWKNPGPRKHRQTFCTTRSARRKIASAMCCLAFSGWGDINKKFFANLETDQKINFVLVTSKKLISPSLGNLIDDFNLQAETCLCCKVGSIYANMVPTWSKNDMFLLGQVKAQKSGRSWCNINSAWPQDGPNIAPKSLPYAQHCPEMVQTGRVCSRFWPLR